jgi:plasmid maintenance system antidote protein VapI
MLEPHLYDGRFVPERQYNIQQLWEQHREILRLLVLGWNPSAIAETLDITEQTVSNVRNSPMGRERLEELQGLRDKETIDITERVRRFMPVALDYLESIVRGEEDVTPGLRARTAENYLSRGGYGTVQKVASVHQHISRSEIEELKERARSAAAQQGFLVHEADYAEVSVTQSGESSHEQRSA